MLNERFKEGFPKAIVYFLSVHLYLFLIQSFEKDWDKLYISIQLNFSLYLPSLDASSKVMAERVQKRKEVMLPFLLSLFLCTLLFLFNSILFFNPFIVILSGFIFSDLRHHNIPLLGCHLLQNNWPILFFFFKYYSIFE